ncbi:MAG: AbrB/MazE/SpoVT family DNA-binding domain-containing protein [Chloroflexota bacterium]|nr:AbrB/MazE/SpoVT family DNA-binding domain-containing protein [Chloroflexota bacterium]
MEATMFRSRLRTKGQITLPKEMRTELNLHEGDDIVFRIDKYGNVVIEKQVTIPADQAWFWSERWQAMEGEAQADIDAGRVTRYSSVDEAINALESSTNAEN